MQRDHNRAHEEGNVFTAIALTPKKRKKAAAMAAAAAAEGSNEDKAGSRSKKNQNKEDDVVVVPQVVAQGSGSHAHLEAAVSASARRRDDEESRHSELLHPLVDAYGFVTEGTAALSDTKATAIRKWNTSDVKYNRKENAFEEVRQLYAGVDGAREFLDEKEEIIKVLTEIYNEDERKFFHSLEENKRKRLVVKHEDTTEVTDQSMMAERSEGHAVKKKAANKYNRLGEKLFGDSFTSIVPRRRKSLSSKNDESAVTLDSENESDQPRASDSASSSVRRRKSSQSSSSAPAHNDQIFHDLTMLANYAGNDQAAVETSAKKRRKGQQSQNASTTAAVVVAETSHRFLQEISNLPQTERTHFMESFLGK
jgi:hypothetical protein